MRPPHMASSLEDTRVRRDQRPRLDRQRLHNGFRFGAAKLIYIVALHVGNRSYATFAAVQSPSPPNATSPTIVWKGMRAHVGPSACPDPTRPGHSGDPSGCGVCPVLSYFQVVGEVIKNTGTIGQKWLIDL
jgi:hypothetical protein